MRHGSRGVCFRKRRANVTSPWFWMKSPCSIMWKEKWDHFSYGLIVYFIEEPVWRVKLRHHKKMSALGTQNDQTLQSTLLPKSNNLLQPCWFITSLLVFRYLPFGCKLTKYTQYSIKSKSPQKVKTSEPKKQPEKANLNTTKPWTYHQGTPLRSLASPLAPAHRFNNYTTSGLAA